MQIRDRKLEVLHFSSSSQLAVSRRLGEKERWFSIPGLVAWGKTHNKETRGKNNRPRIFPMF